MHHDPGAARLARLSADLLRDERALIAEGQRLVLHRGPELVAMSRNLAGAAGERLAKRFGDLVLWGRCPPDDWPIGAVIAMLRTAADLSAPERALHADLLRPLLQLARSADDLHGLRAQVADVEAGGRRPPG